MSASEGFGFVLKQLVRRQDHPRRAEPALQTVLVPERFLKRMKSVRRREPFDSGHLGAVDLDGQAGARLDGDAVDEHRAGATLAGVATDLCAGHAAEIAKKVNEQCARFDLAVETAPVDGNADADGHGPPPGANDRT